MNPQAARISRISALFLCIGLVILASTYLFKSSAAIVTPQTSAPNFENYDLRNDLEKPARKLIETFAAAASKDPSALASDRQRSDRNGDELRTHHKGLIIERNQAGFPETIDSALKSNGQSLGSATRTSRAETLRSFINDNADLFGVDTAQTPTLKITSDYRNPDGNLAFASLQQRVGEIRVFQGEIKAGFTKQGDLFRIINNLAPNLDPENISKDFGAPETAIANAARHIGIQINAAALKPTEAATDNRGEFKGGPFADPAIAEKVYFPIDSGIARTAWQVLLQTDSGGFYVVVDATTGELLWRKNLTEHQTQTATYGVYGNDTSFAKTADGPAPYTPGCPSPLTCVEQPLSPRQNFTLIGNEPPYQFNNNGWINDGVNITLGNNIEAGLDRDGVNGVDPNGHAVGNPFRTFVFNYNPAPGNPPPGSEPLDPVFQMGSVTHAFYMANRWHDETYRLGFTEQARNFQTDNFGRGALGNDSISVEVQDSSGTSGANFFAPSDGNRPRLQLFIWATPTPDRDGALDTQVGFHELTHGLSNRLHGDSLGLTTNMSRGMGEGWSDFYALAMLSEPTDDPAGIYAVGSYSLFGVVPGQQSYYYGIRRFPTAIRSSVGPNGLPHNPLTFRYLNADCNVSIGTTSSNPSSAFPRGPIGVSQCDQTHNAGEIWSAALWEVRHQLILRHGATEGNRRVLQYVTDGMKLAPIGPTMLQERDAIIAATTVSDIGDVPAVRTGFAIRGMGHAATILSTAPASVTESFEPFANVTMTNGFSVSDAPGNNNGFPEPGETVTLNVPLINESGVNITGVTLQLVNGPSAFYGDIAIGQTATQTLTYTIPANLPCGSVLQLTFVINSSAGQRSETRSISLGIPLGGPPATFTNSTPLSIPVIGTSTPYGTSINVSGLSGRKKIKLELTELTHSFVSDLDLLLVGPGDQKYIVMSDVMGNTFGQLNQVITLSDGATSLMPSTAATMGGAWKPTDYSPSDTFPAPAPAAPYISAPTFGTGTFETTFGTQGNQLNGTWTLYVLDDFNGDGGTLNGWKLIFEADDFDCGDPLFTRVRSDFDGDGKTDVSVFRPSEGNWYANGSTSGFMAVHWGANGDIITPGDFDGDDKTDFAVFRPDADSAQPDFYILRSSNLSYTGVSWGLPGDQPVIGDFDGDTIDDIGVYRPSTLVFYVLKSSDGSVLTRPNMPQGTALAGDFDGDGRSDFVTISFNRWYLSPSNTNYAAVSFIAWGVDGDVPVAGDYDGDGRTDHAIFRPSNATWWIRASAGSTIFAQFGISTDIPTPGDFDGDGKFDIGVYRDGTWYINRSTSGMMYSQFGLAGDVPVPKSYYP